MNRNTHRKYLTACITGLLFLMLASFTVSAASLPKLEKKYDFFRSQFGSSSSYGFPFPAGTKLSGIKSTNAKAIKAKAVKFGGDLSLSLFFKKEGTAKISFTAAYKGKTKKYSFTARSWKYVNPVSSLTFGGAEYVEQLDSYSSCFIDKKSVGKKLKFHIQAAEGWKLSKLLLWKKGKSSTKKNNSSFKIEKNMTLEVRMKNKETGAINKVYINPGVG